MDTNVDESFSNDEFLAMGDAIAQLATEIDVATHRLLTHIREFDHKGGWHTAGCLSCAHWLSWRIGMGLGAAREKVRVAKRLAELPLIDAAFAQGQVSYSKVRAMTRWATADNEEQLVLLATQSTAAQLEKMCRMYRGSQLQDRKAEEVETWERYLVSRDTEDGMVTITMKVLPDEAARFMKAAETCAGGQGLIDGAVHMAELALATPHPVDADEDATTVRPPVETVIHISAEDFAGYTANGDGIPAETSRRLLCDCGIVPMLTDAQGQTIDVGRKTRVISTALRRALEHRDGGCQFPGCSNKRFVDAHHIQHWVNGGETSLRNTISICRQHHRFVHEWNYSIERSEDAWEFFRPDGQRVSAAPSRPDVSPMFGQAITALSADDPLASTTTGDSVHAWGKPWPSAPGWDGVPVDYEACVESL
jgi:hypothetical protein